MFNRDKLIEFLKNRLPFKDECEVIYFMILIRKEIESQKENNKYSIIKYYCDWLLHTSKDRHSKNMKQIINNLYLEIENKIKNNDLIKKDKDIDFLFLKHLKKELKDFFNLEKMELFSKNNWTCFTKLLIKSLSNIPIKNINKIKSVIIIGNEYGASLEVYFKEKIIGKKNHDFYKMMYIY